MQETLEIFLVCAPGLEEMLRAEAQEKGFKAPKAIDGGVTVKGDWRTVWRANLELRGATRVLVRIGAFRAGHLSQLDKSARKFPWGEVLLPDVAVRVEATCKKSKIYHAGAAAQRIEKAIAETLGAPIFKDAAVTLKVRIFKDLCTISVDSSGAPLHKRDHKQAVNKAPLRETLAALFLRFCGYRGKETVVDPMCGSGTFVIEAAEIASHVKPGRSRAFAFEQLATFDAEAWQAMKGDGRALNEAYAFYGFDRDAGAVEMSAANAARAGVEGVCRFTTQTISALSPPEGAAGLVIVNPPYGGRIGNTKALKPLYHALGEVLTTRFSGWRVGLITNEDTLAKATGLPFAQESAPVSHGGIRIKLYVSDPLP